MTDTVTLNGTTTLSGGRTIEWSWTAEGTRGDPTQVDGNGRILGGGNISKTEVKVLNCGDLTEDQKTQLENDVAAKVGPKATEFLVGTDDFSSFNAADISDIRRLGYTLAEAAGWQIREICLSSAPSPNGAGSYETLYDNGTAASSLVQVFDADDVEDWTARDISYDTDGQITGQTTYLDNGDAVSTVLRPGGDPSNPDDFIPVVEIGGSPWADTDAVTAHDYADLAGPQDGRGNFSGRSSTNLRAAGGGPIITGAEFTEVYFRLLKKPVGRISATSARNPPIRLQWGYECRPRIWETPFPGALFAIDVAT